MTNKYQIQSPPKRWAQPHEFPPLLINRLVPKHASNPFINRFLLGNTWAIASIFFQLYNNTTQLDRPVKYQEVLTACYESSVSPLSLQSVRHIPSWSCQTHPVCVLASSNSLSDLTLIGYVNGTRDNVSVTQVCRSLAFKPCRCSVTYIRFFLSKSLLDTDVRTGNLQICVKVFSFFPFNLPCRLQWLRVFSVILV